MAFAVDHHLLVLLQRPQQQQEQQQQEQQQRVPLRHPVLLQYTLLQRPLRVNITPVQAVIFLAAASHATYSSGSPHPRFDTDTHEGERRRNIRSQDVPCLGLLHEVAPAVPSAGRTRARTSRCLRCQDGKECLYTHYGTKALIQHSHTASYYIIHPRRFARIASYERSCFWRITTQAHPKTVVVIVVHHIS